MEEDYTGEVWSFMKCSTCGKGRPKIFKYDLGFCDEKCLIDYEEKERGMIRPAVVIGLCTGCEHIDPTSRKCEVGCEPYSECCDQNKQEYTDHESDGGPLEKVLSEMKK